MIHAHISNGGLSRSTNVTASPRSGSRPDGQELRPVGVHPEQAKENRSLPRVWNCSRDQLVEANARAVQMARMLMGGQAGVQGAQMNTNAPNTRAHRQCGSSDMKDVERPRSCRSGSKDDEPGRQVEERPSGRSRTRRPRPSSSPPAWRRGPSTSRSPRSWHAQVGRSDLPAYRGGGRERWAGVGHGPRQPRHEHPPKAAFRPAMRIALRRPKTAS